MRFHQFLPTLEAAGWEPTFAPLMTEAIVARIGLTRGVADWIALIGSYGRRLATMTSARKYDAMWIEKELLPFMPGWLERILLGNSVPYVVDFDDAIFHNYDLHPRRFVRLMLAGKFDRILPASAAVTAGSRYLADYASEHGARHVIDVPSAVDAARYPVAPYPSGDQLRVAWIGSGSTTRHLQTLLPVLAEVATRTDVKLVTIGASTLHQPGLAIEQHAWAAASEAALLGSCHVGIMPLPDSPWERGKCAFKLVQYMAAGRPVVASPVGANLEVVSPVVGRLAASDTAWFDALVDCAARPAEWAEMGRAARARFEAGYSTTAVGPRILACFDEIAAVR